MKKSILFLAALLVTINVFSQNIIFQENFDIIPYGSNVTSSSTGTTSWGINSNLYTSGTRSDSCVISLGDTIYLTTDTFGTIGNYSVYLDFKQICKIEFYDAAFIEVSIDNGTTWTKVVDSMYLGLGNFGNIGDRFTATSYTNWLPANNNAIPTNSWWQNETFDISPLAANQSVVKIRFALIDINNTGSAGNYGWLLDDIKVTASYSELIPPAITMVTPMIPDTVYSTGPYQVKAEIIDNSGIDTAILYYFVSTGYSDTVGMSIIGPDTFSANIPFFGFGKTITYYVKAIDAAPAANADSSSSYSFYCKYSSGGSFIVGTGTVVNGAMAYPAPYGNYWWGSKHQMIIPASEMAAVNMVGGQIESVAFDVTAVNSCPGLQNYTIKIGTTNLSAITTAWQSGLTTVYTNSSYQPTTGWNVHTFQTPFNWDGVSNIIVETCFNNSSYVSNGNASVNQTATSYTSTHLVYGDNANNCSSPGIGSTQSQRPNMQFVVSGVLSLDLDIGAYQITNPTGGVLASQDFEVKFNIKNFGSDSVVKATVNWELDNVLQTPFVYLATNYDTIWKDSVSAEIILDTLNIGVGAHSIKIWTLNPNDTSDYNSGNDTAYVSFFACSSLLSGNYTIGGTNPDFADFSAAVMGLDQCGINGPVTFTVASGTYNEQIELPFVTGSSATNTITFQSASGDSSTVILTNNASSATGNYTLKLNGTSHITFKDMTFAATDSLLSKVIEIGNSAENVHFLNNRIIGMSTSITDEDAALIYTSDSIGNNISILNNRLENGSIAIELSGKSSCSTKATGVQINNNILMNHFASGIILTNLFSPEVSLNQIETNSNSNSYNGISGIQLSGTPIIIKNNIKATNTQIAYGIRMSQCDICMSSTNSGLVANNFILINGLSTANTITAGILNNESKNFNYYYNTINITGNQTNAVSMCLFDATAGLSDNINIVNNIFSNEANGYTYYVTGVDTTKFFVDYNDIFNPGTGTFAYLGAAVTDFATWKTKTAEETHSITINPYFSSAINLHTTNNLVNGTGTPIAGITDDIDGDLRNATTPDIGADEFAPSPYDIATLEIIAPIDGCGLDTNEVVTIRIKNLGSATVNGGFTASYKINNNTAVTESVSSTILSGDTLDYSFSNTANLDVFALMIDSTYEFKAWVDLTTDPVHYNDTAVASVFSGYLPPSPVTSDTSINYGDSVTLTAQHADSVFYWYEHDTSSVELYTGEFFTTPVLYDTTTYWVSVSGGGGILDSVHPSTYASTYTAVAGLRGYHFQAPVDFVITGLRVPINVGTDPQSVEVLQFTTAPSGSTSPHTVLFHAAMVPGTGYIPCNIPITMGDYISINGSRGTGTHKNNYAPSTPISIYGINTVIGRSWSNSAALYTNPTPSGTVTRLVGGSISQVDFLYGSAGGGCESNRAPLNVNVINIPTVELGISAITTNSGCNMTNAEQVTIDIYNQGFVAATDSIYVSYRIDSNSFITQEIVIDTIAPGDTISYTFNTTANLSVVINDTTYTITAYVAHPQDVYAVNDTLVSGLIEALYTPPAPIVSDTIVPYGSIITLTGISNDTLYWYNTPVDTNYMYMGSYFTTPLLYDTTTYYVEAKAGSSGSYTLGTGTTTNTSTGYPTPYGNYYYGSKNQFLILASELSAMGMTAGDIKSVAFDVANVNACPGLTNYEIKLKNIPLTALTTAWESGLTSVYLNPSYQPVTGWNTHTFTTSFNWDGTSNLIIETCFNNTSYPSNGCASVNQTSTTFAATHEYHTDGATVCSAPGAGLTYNQRANMVLYAASSGCPSPRVALNVNVSAPPQFDAGIKSIHTPFTDFDLTANEAVQVMVMNTGTDSIYNFPLAYKIDNLPPVIDTFTNVLHSGDSALFTFATPADMSVYKIYDVKTYTMLPLDSTFMNDTSSTQVENKMIVYCVCTATSGSYEDITNVTIANLNNTSTVPASGSMYSDYTSLPPAILAPGQTYNVSITTSFAVGNTYQYNCWVNVFIDYNHDGIYTPATEIAFSSTTTSSNTVTGTITVPQTATSGVATGIRVAFRESGNQANTGPCGTFTWGEVEDYKAFIMPLIPNDAGVTEIIQPGSITNESASTPVEVVVKNFGTDTITSMSIDYKINNGTPVTNSYTGTLPPSATDTVTLTSFSSPAGNSNICAYTVLTGDTNTFNDGICKAFFGIPSKDAFVTGIVEIDDGCGLGSDTIMIWINNIGVDTINGFTADTITAHYQLDGVSTIVTENMPLTINPGDSALFVFNAQANFAVTTADSVFDIAAWANLTGDNVHYNDTAYSDVESLHTPADPIVISPITVPYASPATISAISPTADTLIWYDSLVGGNIIGGGPTYTTGLMYNPDTFYVQAGGGLSGAGVNIAPLAVASASPACNTGACSTLNDLNFGTCGTQQTWITSSASNPGSAVNVTFVWPTPHLINKMTINVGQNNTRFLTGGTVQIWNGSAWISHTTFTQSIGVCFYDIVFPPVSTTRIRIIDMTVGGSQSSNVNFREIEIYDVLQSGCASNRIPVIVNVSAPSACDVGVFAIPQPTSAINLTSSETVSVKVKNYGTAAQTNIPVYYQINANPPVVDTITSTINPSDSLLFTFATSANLGMAGNTYSLKAYTALTCDSVQVNDTTWKSVQHMLPNYCACSATSGAYEDLTNVTISNLNNSSTVPASGSMYTDFSSTVAPAQLAPGVSYPISISSDYAVYTSSYTCWVNVFIDFNRDGVFDPNTERAFGSTTSSSNTVTGTLSVPFNALSGLTKMRVVLRESGTQANTGPCGPYTWGETEDYNVSIAPKLHQDAGVVDIIQPTTMSSSAPTPIEVIIVNYGIDAIDSIDVSYQLNSANPYTVTLTDTILPLDSFYYSFPAIVLPTGQNTICAYTTLLGDSNTFNDQKCITSFVQLMTTPPYFDNFEGADYWLPDTIPNQWERGIPTAQTINTAHSSSTVWMIQLDTNYNNNSFDYLYTPKFIFGLVTPDSLSFWHYVHTQSTYDGGRIQYLNNTGFWSTLGDLNDTNGTNWYNTTQTGIDMWTGNSNGWQLSTYDLTSVNDLANIAQFRFIFSSDNTTNNFDGWAIDDFRITVPKLPKDAGVTHIITPVDSTMTGSNVTVQITIQNFGTDTLDTIPVNYAVTGQAATTATWSGYLLPNATDIYTFSTPYSGPNTLYELCAWTSITADTHFDNDTICKNISTIAAADDVGIIEIINPDSITAIGYNVTVIAKIHNFGTNTVTSIPVEYEYGINLIQGTWTGTLLPNATENYTFTTPYPSPIGNYNLCVRTKLTGDADLTNDEICEGLLGTIGIDEYDDSKFILLQNVPNPTKGITTIGYIVPKAGKIKFEVINLLGKTIYSENKNVLSGKNQIDLDVNTLPSGIYYYSVIFDGKRLVKKMIKN